MSRRSPSTTRSPRSACSSPTCAPGGGGLALRKPVEAGGNCSWVAPGVDRDGREVVLKVAWQHAEALHEAEGLAALGGQGAVEVYAFEHLTADATAMLLERCRPGTE